MIEEKLVVGAITQFRVPREADLKAPPDSGDFVLQPRKGFAWGNTPFLWLHYFPRKVSEIEARGMDVLSGEFSGCWMVIYRKNAAIHVGHIGTVDAAHSVPVKKAWTRFAFDLDPGNLIAAFNPFNQWAGPTPVRTPADKAWDGTNYLYGLVTSTCRCYAVYLYPQINDPGGAKRRVAGIQEIVPRRGTDALRNLFPDEAAEVRGELGNVYGG
jgi:hypothetical protein